MWSKAAFFSVLLSLSISTAEDSPLVTCPAEDGSQKVEIDWNKKEMTLHVPIRAYLHSQSRYVGTIPAKTYPLNFVIQKGGGELGVATSIYSAFVDEYVQAGGQQEAAVLQLAFHTDASRREWIDLKVRVFGDSGDFDLEPPLYQKGINCLFRVEPPILGIEDSNPF